jgi:hypothetical protein
MQIKNLRDTIDYLRTHMLSANDVDVTRSEEVTPVVIRKTPKFPSRDRHLAIRRRKQPTSPESQRSEHLSFCDSEESEESE